jgi:UDP-N-acetylmuramoylalanine-D-glutamate ligase
MNINGKNISVIGAVRSGVGAARLIKKLGGKPFVSDMADEGKLARSIEVLRQNEIEYETGSHSDKVYQCDRW